ncbi:MAG TPA: UDP-N-acetylmuramate--L-alanine ligase [Bacteroidales bacterium]|nr:UDP-N-acetylmuramate--L-alanine ligase [Bacteroidales bacterium]
MFKDYQNIWFLGIGGIGMSALARYMMLQSKLVSGYDRAHSVLTSRLAKEGVSVVFDDDVALIPEEFTNAATTLVVTTPAISSENRMLKYFQNHNFKIVKRAQLLGNVSIHYKTIAVAGTHGKTTISTMIAHLLRQSAIGCTALLGGIAKGYDTNFFFSTKSPFFVTEADEFDRSFLSLHPHMAVITSTDADHLDVYGQIENLIASFNAFAGQTDNDGILLVKKDAAINRNLLKEKRIFSYALTDSSADAYATNIWFSSDFMVFDLVTPEGVIKKLQMEPTGIINIENAVAASFIALQSGITEDELRSGLAGFKGVVRRFDKQFSSPEVIYIDDYAHHPNEIRALIRSIKSIYGNRKITGIFQPHLFSRTRDFAGEFASSLQELDEILLLDIYPAREKPIENVSANTIYQLIDHPRKALVHKETLLEYLNGLEPELLLTIGAGDIDKLVAPIRNMLEKKYQKPSSS